MIVDGFFEWRVVAGKKVPYLIAREDRAPMAMAGIYDASDGCAIITAPSDGVVATLHDRMPVVLAWGQHAAWIDPKLTDVRPILAAATADGLMAYPVSRAVNSVKNDDPRLIERSPDPELEPLALDGGLAQKGETLPLLFGPTPSSSASRRSPS